MREKLFLITEAQLNQVANVMAQYPWIAVHEAMSTLQAVTQRPAEVAKAEVPAPEAAPAE